MSALAASSEAANRVWFRRGPALLSAEGVGEGCLFDPDTGETHFLSELPALILSVIDQAPVTYAELVDRLAGPDPLDQQSHGRIFAALVSLETAELVESPGVEAE